MARRPDDDPIDRIAKDVLRGAFLFDQPGDYRQGVLDALAAVRSAITAQKRELQEGVVNRSRQAA